MTITEMPHPTVACIVEDAGKFLIVEEQAHGQVVYNQPAGHIEPGETAQQAAVREVLEETGWQVALDKFVGVYHYLGVNGVTYIRLLFTAKAEKKVSEEYDSGIIGPHWLTLEEVQALGPKLRSHLVSQCIEDAVNGPHYPLELIKDF